jgi:hypothetical protein
VTADLPDDASLEVCLDACLQEVCHTIAQRHDLPDDIRDVLCGAAATLAVAFAFLPKNQGRARIKKCRVRRRRVM